MARVSVGQDGGPELADDVPLCDDERPLRERDAQDAKELGAGVGLRGIMKCVSGAHLPQRSGEQERQLAGSATPLISREPVRLRRNNVVALGTQSLHGRAREEMRSLWCRRLTPEGLHRVGKWG